MYLSARSNERSVAPCQRSPGPNLSELARQQSRANVIRPPRLDRAGGHELKVDDKFCLFAQTRSKIDKLSILGIRSFDNTRSETIQFHTPLTLIVGLNGSGKTSIIECLKYATTGELPPNSKGGAFIHDPKLAGEKEVLAQTKLSFKATTGARMVVTRSLQLTVKKTTRQQKTLEGQLLMIKNGERTSISSRVAELDQIMPRYLGVSKAILDAVIFCHQDESLWPMSEPSVLKKKFDEIFEALKYTKAIDNIKQLRKKQNEELAKYKIMEQHAKENKNKADRAEKRSIMLQEDIEGLRAESHELSKRMRQTASLADKAWKESEGYAKIIGALEGKRIEARSLEVNIRKLSEHLVPVEESEEWLESTLAEFDSHQAEYHKEERALKDRYNHFKWEIQAKRGDQSAKQTEYGKHETAKAQYERQVQRRELLIQDIVRKNEIRGFDGELDEAEIADFLQTIKKLFRERNQALERERRAAQSELREAQSTLNQLGQRKSALQETKNSMRKQIVQNERQASTYQRLLDGISADEGIKAVLESRIDETEQAIARERERIRTASWDEAIESKTAEIRTQEERNSRLNAELINGTKRAGELARFEHLKKELADRQRSVETMSGAHGERIERYITQPWAPATLEHEFQTRLEAASADLAAAERERDAVSRDLERVDFQLRTTRKDLKQRQAQRDDCARRVNEATEEDDPADYPQVVVQLQNQLNLYKEDSDRYAGIKSYMESCLEIVRKKSACRTCNRAFRNDKESKAFENKIIDILNKPVDEEAVSQAEEDLEHVRVVGSYYDTWVRLSNTEIPELEKEAVELDGEREKVLSRVERHDQVRDERREAKQNVESLSKPVATISRCEHDIRTLRAQIDELAVNQQEPGATRTLEQIQEEISSVTEIVRALQKTIGKLSSEREESRSGLTRLELKLRDIRSELADTAHQLDKKAGLMARVDEYKELNAKQREGIAKADQDIEDIVPEVDKAQERYDDISSRAERRERELQQGVSQLTDHVHQLQMVGEEITTYIEHDGPRQLERCAAELAQIQEAIGELEGGQAMVTREANALAKRLQDSENTKRQYADNLHYRQEQRALDAVQGEIATLAAHNAEIDRGRFKQESERHTREHNALSAKQASKMGEMKSKDDQLMQLLADWNTDYKDAGPKYREAHIRVETTRAAADDLARYGGALDKAIMTYHGLKMEQINGIIAELWQKTYRGTDVDSICIRSDAEGARGNRSYNYRVCMRKLDVEMDMRGRCSAGQKVLASIIIRLALAECFGVACGLIALDEPTTNLDRDNIHSLALALHDIIRLRRQQANFQLIVITHDEDFLRAMRCGDFCDYYYRVGRNERQKSVVERQSIAEIM